MFIYLFNGRVTFLQIMIYNAFALKESNPEKNISVSSECRCHPKFTFYPLDYIEQFREKF